MANPSVLCEVRFLYLFQLGCLIIVAKSAEAFLCKGMFDLISVYFVFVSSIITMYFVFKHNPPIVFNRMVSHGIDIYSNILIVVNL